MKNLSLKICLVIAALLASVGSGFASDLPDCIKSAKVWNYCIGTHTDESGEFVGEWQNNKRKGQATMTFLNGDKYVGAYSDDKLNGQGTYTWAKSGNKYVGEYRDDKRTGQGTYSYASGDKYVGEHRDDKRTGQGTFTWANGDKYVGEYKDGKRNGQGTYTYADGTVEEGIWKDDEFQYAKKLSPPVPVAKTPTQDDEIISASSGSGLTKCQGSPFTFKDPDITDYWSNCVGKKFYAFDESYYLGGWKNGEWHGHGTYVDGTESSKYIGQWVLGRKNGQGTKTYADGTVKEGIFKDDEFKYAKKLSPPVPVAKAPTQDDEIISTSDLPDCPDDPGAQWHNCLGTFTYTNGDKYVGEWAVNKKHGQGAYNWIEGDRYIGGWIDGKKSGPGIYTDPDGRKYNGTYKNDKKHGRGTFIDANGAKFVGEFSEGKENGIGELTFPNRNTYVGGWRNGDFNGQGTYTFAESGNKYVGEYRDGKRNGQGTFTYTKSGNKYVGEFKDNKRHGIGTYTFASGSKDVGEFKDGKLNGYATRYFSDGSILKEGIWKDDEFQYAKKLSPPVPVAKTPTQDDEIISASSGSGFAVSSDGYVITNHHVIDGCQKVVVHTKKKDLTVRVITYDPQNDLALLKGDFRPSTVFPLSSNRPELLQDIYVAGYPFGNEISTSVKVTKGIISSLTGIGNNFSNIQIDAALQSGNSGGPILDDLGNVVGVAVSKLDAKYMFDNYGSIPENTNFGIKSIIVRSIMDSNEVDGPSANQSEISKSKLGKMISSGTYYISCWMTMAQIEKMKTKKAFFSELD